ncbi:MAG TPA: glycerol-3-phosphate 1-O-acyltransferase PlsY [Chthoniobacterales bacterium]
MLTVFYVAIVGYLVGSFPTAYIAGRIRGIDIRKAGSGNVGATNAARVLGKRFGYFVFIVDVAKGFVAVILSRMLGGSAQTSALFVDLCGVLGAMFAVIGHSYPVWLSFKGGKGVATSIGALFALNWIPAAIVGIVWIVVFLTTRYVSLASIGAAIALPIMVTAMYFLKELSSPVLVYFCFLLAAIVVIRHRSNISRLLTGTEHRFVKK